MAVTAQIALVVAPRDCTYSSVALLAIVLTWKRGFARAVPTARSGFAIDTMRSERVTIGHASANSLRLLTYNMFLRPPGTPGSAHGYGSEEFKDERLAQFFRLLEKEAPECQVLCLQEIFAFGSFRRERLLAFARERGFNYYMCPPAPPLLDPVKWMDAGLLIVSKYPIVDGHHLCFAGPATKGDVAAAKGAIHAQLNVYGKSIHVFTTHLQASTLGSETEYETTIRLSQLAQLAKFVKSIAGEDAAIVAGDFNVDAHRDRTKVRRLSSVEPAEASAEYVAMVGTLRKWLPHLVDVALQSNRAHPVTCGEVYETRSHLGAEPQLKPMDTELAMLDEQSAQSCLDYVFYIPQKADRVFTPPVSPRPEGYGMSMTQTHTPSIPGTAASVARFLAPGTAYKQCSDHYGIFALLPIDSTR